MHYIVGPSLNNLRSNKKKLVEWILTFEKALCFGLIKKFDSSGIIAEGTFSKRCKWEDKNWSPIYLV